MLFFNLLKKICLFCVEVKVSQFSTKILEWFNLWSKLVSILSCLPHFLTNQGICQKDVDHFHLPFFVPNLFQKLRLSATKFVISFLLIVVILHTSVLCWYTGIESSVTIYSFFLSFALINSTVLDEV